jgi:hypothetical protein
MNNQTIDNKNINDKNIQSEENIQGSTLIGDEKELRKMDDWRAHTHERDRNPRAEYREGELHGVVGKEIFDELKRENEETTNGQKSETKQSTNLTGKR